MNSCTACKRGKRKCDRQRPRCSTCSRVGRGCVYEEDAFQHPPFGVDNRTPRPGSSVTLQYAPPSLPTVSVPEELLARSNVEAMSSIDPFRQEALRRPTVDAIVGKELLKTFGFHGRIHEVANLYFSSASNRIPILSAKRFYKRMPSASSPDCPADFAALCLCTYLVLEIPQPSDACMQSSLYVMVKGILSLLEAASYQTLETVQCRVLVAFYEMGHGIYPAAAMSLGACAKLARIAGIHRELQPLEFQDDRDILIEERRRTWWAVHNLDRYLNLCLEESICATPFPIGTDPLPTEESLWSRNIAPSPIIHTLNTPSDVTIGSFARECQICHLVGRVLRNVYEPTSDASFQTEEASQIEATMLALIPLLQEDGVEFGKYCISFAICSSALFTLYSSSLENGFNAVDVQARRLGLLKETSLQVTHYSRRLFGIEEEINYGDLSPLVPYALYQSAVIQLWLLRRIREVVYEENIDFLKRVLGLFNKRWRVAGIYERKLETESPPLLLPPTQY